MNNALFMTGLATFFHIWGGAMLGTAIAKVTAKHIDDKVFPSIIGGALLAFISLLVMGPTWVALDQPMILAVEMLILVAAIGIPMFVPVNYREAVFGVRTYLVWLGLGLALSGVYLIFLPKDMAACMGLFTLLAGFYFLRRGVGMLRKH